MENEIKSLLSKYVASKLKEYLTGDFSNWVDSIANELYNNDEIKEIAKIDTPLQKFINRNKLSDQENKIVKQFKEKSDRFIYEKAKHKWLINKQINKKIFNGIIKILNERTTRKKAGDARPIEWVTRIYDCVMNKTEGALPNLENRVIRCDDIILDESIKEKQLYYNDDIIQNSIQIFMQNYEAHQSSFNRYFNNTLQLQKTTYFNTNEPVTDIFKEKKGNGRIEEKKTRGLSSLETDKGKTNDIKDEASNYIEGIETADEAKKHQEHRRRYLDELDVNKRDTEVKQYSNTIPYNDDRIYEYTFRYYLFRDLINYNATKFNDELIAKRFIPKYEFVKRLNNTEFYPITEYHKHRVLALRPEMETMEHCLSKLKEGVKAFNSEIEKQKKVEQKKKKDTNTARFSEDDKKKIPMLSAAAIDKDGKLLASCYKGEKEELNPQGEPRTFELHCEYILLKILLEDNARLHELQNGTLFVTLEPCNKRKYYCQNKDCHKNCEHEKVEPKIPCAVRCLESGAKRIYVSNADTDPNVLDKGIFILKTGTYPIELMQNDEYVLYETHKDKQKKESRGLKELEKYFKKKKYEFKKWDKKKFLHEYPKVKLSKHTTDIRLYTISAPMEVFPFHPEITRDIIELNTDFLQNKGKDYFLHP